MSSSSLKKNNKNKIQLNEPEVNKQSPHKFLSKTNPNRKKNSQLSKVILKGKLFGLINKSNIMTEEQFNDIKIKLGLSQLEKYKENKRKINESFYYAQKNPNLLTFFKSSNKFEDDYINMRDLLSRQFTPNEQKIILSFPQFFQLNSNEFLKELVDEKHKNLYEILGNEEKKEIAKRNLKRKNRIANIKFYQNPSEKYFNNKYDNINYEALNSNNNSKIKIIDKLNSKNKSKSRNSYFNNSLYKNNTSKIKSTYNTSNSKLRTFNGGGELVFPLIRGENKMNNYHFHEDIGEKYRILSKMIENKIINKFENMKKRKEMVRLKNKIKLEQMKDRNIKEQNKKEQERLKIYHEKKYIEYIVTKLKKNYIQTNKDNVNEEKEKDKEKGKEIENKNDEDENKSITDSKSNMIS